MTYSRRTDCPTGPAKVIDGDTIVVSDQLVRLHGIDAPELDQTFQWRGQQIACGTMSLAALEALIAGVKVRCEVVDTAARVSSPKGNDIGRRCLGALAYRRYSTDYVQAEARKAKRGDVAGDLRQALGVARIVPAAAHTWHHLGHQAPRIGRTELQR